VPLLKMILGKLSSLSKLQKIFNLLLVYLLGFQAGPITPTWASTEACLKKPTTLVWCGRLHYWIYEL